MSGKKQVKKNKTNTTKAWWHWYSGPIYWGAAATEDEAYAELDKHTTVPVRDCEWEVSKDGGTTYFRRGKHPPWSFLGHVVRIEVEE